MADEYNPDWSQTRTLYVILQGEFALYREQTNDPVSDRLHIMAPDVPLHEYKAGPWLTDWRDAPDLPRTLSLENTFGDRKNGKLHCCRSIPETNGDILFKLGKESLSPDTARVHIIAPMPLAVLPGLMESAKTVKITVKNDDGTYSYPPVPPNPTVIPILVYKWYEFDDPPFLTDGQDFTVSAGGPSDDFLSLQIYASSSVREDKPHAQQAFTAAAALLNVKATVDWDDSASFTISHATPPAGLSWAQINLFLWQILRFDDPEDERLTRDYLDLSDPRLNLPFDPGTMRTSDSGNCGPVTG